MADVTKVQVPDGNGGWTETRGEVHPGGKVDAAKQAAALAHQFSTEAGRLTEKLLQFDFLYIRDHGLEKEHRAFAAALYCINLREHYPDGPEAFDKVAADAAAYYDAHAPKKAGKPT